MGPCIVVNGIVSSNYVTALEKEKYVKVGNLDTGLSWHFASHMWNAPYRVVCTKISPKLCKDETFDEDGFPFWSHVGRIMMVEFEIRENVLKQVGVYTIVVPAMILIFTLGLLIDQVWLFALLAFGIASINSKKMPIMMSDNKTTTSKDSKMV
jgi:hypothetical protein